MCKRMESGSKDMQGFHQPTTTRGEAEPGIFMDGKQSAVAFPGTLFRHMHKLVCFIVTCMNSACAQHASGTVAPLHNLLNWQSPQDRMGTVP